MIRDWRELKVGSHYRLQCGCEGFVKEMALEPSEDLRDTGFIMLYTSNGCNKPFSYQKAYYEGYGPYTNYFNYSLSFQAMPAEEVPAPAWYPSLEAGPRKAKPIPNPVNKKPLEVGLFVEVVNGENGYVVNITENKFVVLVTGNGDTEADYQKEYEEGLRILKSFPLDTSYMEWRPPFWLADFPGNE